MNNLFNVLFGAFFSTNSININIIF